MVLSLHIVKRLLNLIIQKKKSNLFLKGCLIKKDCLFQIDFINRNLQFTLNFFVSYSDMSVDPQSVLIYQKISKTNGLRKMNEEKNKIHIT